MHFDILTTVPGMIEPVVSESIIGRAMAKGLVQIEAVDLRDYAHDRHHTTDDAPYGGGPGMVIKCEPVFEAVEDMLAKSSGPKPRVLMMTPQGRRFDQAMAEELAREHHIILLCGRYEGFDERIREHLVDDEVSIGDFVITGGELAAMVITDAVCRLLPGVLGDDQSSHAESFSTGLLEYPQYTRPAEFRNWKVPEILLSGNHAQIEQWRREMSLVRTAQRRPELLDEKAAIEAEKISEKNKPLIDINSEENIS